MFAWYFIPGDDPVGRLVMRNDSGSILPLGIGVVCLTAVFVFIMVELIGVQFQTLENKQLADVAALAVATDLNHDQIAPIVNLDYLPPVLSRLTAAAEFLGVAVSGAKVSTTDGRTIVATICSNWKSITGFSVGEFGEICATSKARSMAQASG